MTIDPIPAIIALVVVGFALVILADFGALAWLRQRFRIPDAAPWQQGMPSPDAANDAPTADQVYFAAAERFLDTQVATNDVLDTKMAGTVGIGSTILPLTFGLLSISGRPLHGATQWLLFGAVIT